MRGLSVVLGGLLALGWGPVQAQGLDEDELVELIEETVRSNAERRLSRLDAASTPEDRAAAVRIARVLEGQQLDVRFEDEDLVEVLGFLQDVSGLNLVISRAAREALEDEGHAVNLRLFELSLRHVLEQALRQAHPRLRYGVRHGVLMIGLSEEWREQLFLEFYEVSDLIHRPEDFPGPRIGLEGLQDE